MERLKRDIEALAGMVRDSASAGERAAAEWAQERLFEAGVPDVALEPYRWPRTHAWAHLPHLAAAFTKRRLLAVAALVSYELDQSGRRQWIQRLLPKGEGLNVVGRIPARQVTERTFVLVAHLDAQRSGFMWDRRIIEAGAKARLKRRAMSPAGALAALAIATRNRPLLALVTAAVLDTATRPTVPGANDNASGVAATIELARRLADDPLQRTEVLVVLPGAEESGMGGMRAFLAEHPLDPARAFVFGLDTVGSGTPVIAQAEGSILPHRYRDEDLELVERAAPDDPPQRWRIAAWTDPVLALFAGLPAVSMLSVGPKGMYTRYHRMDDLPEHVDLACVARCADVAEASARAFDAR